MNTLELLLFQVGEECSELAKAVSKVARFGILTKRPRDGKVNLQEVVDEYNDILGSMQLLIAEIEARTGQKVEGLGDPIAIRDRITKIVTMAGVSQKLGLLVDPELPKVTTDASV